MGIRLNPSQFEIEEMTFKFNDNKCCARHELVYMKMKRLFVFMIVVLSFIVNDAYAQEVRGVETRLANFEEKQVSQSQYEYYLDYEFYNMNSCDVSVDAELYRARTERHNYVLYCNNQLISTKSFVLKAGESYVWRSVFSYFYSGDKLNKIESKTSGFLTSYYVKYKAFRLITDKKESTN